MRKLKGYTLVEALISISLLSFVLLGVYGVLTTGNAVTANDNALLEMQQQARNGMDRIVREVRESSSQTIVTVDANSDRITFTTPNEAGIQYYRSGTALVREYPAGTVKNVAGNIAYLKFTLAATLLKVSIRADKVIYSKTVSFPLTENVRLRNE